MNKLPFHSWLFPEQLILNTSQIKLIPTDACRTPMNVSQNNTSIREFSSVILQNIAILKVTVDTIFFSPYITTFHISCHYSEFSNYRKIDPRPLFENFA